MKLSLWKIMDAFNFVSTSVNQLFTNAKFRQVRIVGSAEALQALDFVVAKV